ncbi:hypothetical protein [Sneathiella sp.]|uniref:hypothetical protein n=1 Tax=Sneathiella sp. TaxID=1964365 RepID=UPI0025D20B75|nr:hypothetical protein [Sneathiella sp.]
MTRLTMALGLTLFGAQFAQASYEAGKEALDRNDAVAAIEEWQPAAKRGDVNAQVALGKIYEKGAEGINIDLVGAYAWYNLAAAQGNEEADTAIERLKSSMSPEEIQDGEAQSIAALGFWFRNFTGQDEAAFQVAKAAVGERDLQQNDDSAALAEQRAAEQRELIAQRKAEAEAKAKALEESREAAILAAQAQAEEAKRQAALREQQIEEQRMAIAQKDATTDRAEKDAARARLAALMAKQNGSSAVTTTTMPSVPQPKITKIKPAPAPAIKKSVPAQAEQTSSEEMSAKVEPVQPIEPVKENAATDAKPEAVKKAEPVADAKEMTVADAAKPQQMESVAKAEPALTDEKSAALASLKKKGSLNNDAVEQIFEQAKIANLDTPTAQAEIEQSIVRIEALKWSLISGAKGDTAAPKLNKVLMSKMSPVQIAEANRLASEWLIERQSEL